jgi:hypothetical protein
MYNNVTEIKSPTNFLNHFQMSLLNSTKPTLDLDMCPTAQYFVDDILFQIFFYCLYAFVFCVGTLGNALVVYIILRNKSMQNPTNLFIANLACSDILMCLFSVPFTPVQSFTGKWLFGEVKQYFQSSEVPKNSS